MTTASLDEIQLVEISPVCDASGGGSGSERTMKIARCVSRYPLQIYNFE